MGEGKRSVGLWLGLGLLLSLSLRTVNCTSASQSFLLLRWDRLAYSGLELGISVPSCRLGSNKTAAGWALVSFSWGQSLLRTECSRVFADGSISPPPPGSMGGFFSLKNSLWEPDWAVVGKIHKCVGFPIWLGLRGVFNSSELPTLSLLSITVRNSSPGNGCCRGFCLWVFALITFDSLYSSICLPVLGLQFALWLHFSFRSKKSCWLFSLFSFLLVVRMVCYL